MNYSENHPNPLASKESLFFGCVFVLLLLLTWLIYQPAVSGPFLLDDFDNLGAMSGGVNDLYSLEEYMNKGKAGPLGRPISKLSFLINDNSWPSTADTFKRTNLLIHLLTGVLIFACLRLLLKIHVGSVAGEWLALFLTAVFLLHPIQVSTVMYVVQRMTQLASLFVVVAILIHSYFRTKYHSFSLFQLFLMGLGVSLFTLMSMLSKESGALLPVYLLVIELTLLSKKPIDSLFKWWRRIFLWLPTTVLISYVFNIPKWVERYNFRDFSLYERLMTEPVILFDYVGSILRMNVFGLGLYHDDYTIYSKLLEKPVLFSLLGIILLLAGAIKLRRGQPLIAFGILWFLAGHLLESTTIPLELYFEHRNYLPMIGVVVFVVGVLKVLAGWAGEDLKKFSPFLAVAVLVICSMATYGYTQDWSENKRLIPLWANEHPESPRAQRAYAHTLASIGMPQAALTTLDEAVEKFPEDMSMLILSIDISCVFGMPFRYDLEELAENTSEFNINNGLRPAMQTLFGRLEDQKCLELSDGLHSLVDELKNIGKGDTHKRMISAFNMLSGDLYLREQKTYNALLAYVKIEENTPSVDSALRLSNTYLLLVDYDKARNFLSLAREREGSGVIGMASGRYKVYEEKFKMISEMEKRYFESLNIQGSGLSEE